LSSVRFATAGVITTSLIAAISTCSAVAPANAGGGVHRHPIRGSISPTGGRNSQTSTALRGMQTPRLGSHSSSPWQSSLKVQGLDASTQAP
jgi:hypothetical protein